VVTLILDGYNVIHAVPQLAQAMARSLEAGREALLRVCQEYRAKRKDVARLYVVFDGDEAKAPWVREDRSGVTVLFTRRKEEADDRILRLINSPGSRGEVAVVTNDGGVANSARVLGARVMSVRTFMAQAAPADARGARRCGEAQKPMPPAREAQRITEDYRRYLEEKANDAS
jgi:predicted RNA-binding protein with PIN domain